MAAKKKTKDGPPTVDNFTFDMLLDIFGDDAVIGEASPDIKGYISTGSRRMDWELAERRFRGGYPSGRMAEFFGDEATGKTTLVTHAMISAQRGNGTLVDWVKEGGRLICRESERKMKPGLAILIDSECKYPIDRAQRMGLDIEKLVRIVKPDGEPMSFEECIEAIESCVDRVSKITYFDKPEAPVVIVLDSIAQSPIEAEIEGSGLQDGIAAKARKIRMAMRRMTQKLSRMHIYMLFTNHQYARIGAPGSEASGGRGLKLAASLRFALKKKYQGEVMASSTEQIGITSEVKTAKSSVCIPPNPIGVPIIWATGVNQAFEIVNYLTEEVSCPMLKSVAGGRLELITSSGEIRKPYKYQLVKEMEADPVLFNYLASMFDGNMRQTAFS